MNFHARQIYHFNYRLEILKLGLRNTKRDANPGQTIFQNYLSYEIF
jgi:hypothetical protein